LRQTHASTPGWSRRRSCAVAQPSAPCFCMPPSFFSSHGDHRDLHSFPTRRSSDLAVRVDGGAGVDGAGRHVYVHDLGIGGGGVRSEEHTSELQSRGHLVCRLLLEKKKQPNKSPDWPVP